jgi:chromosome segregation ATPase
MVSLDEGGETSQEAVLTLSRDTLDLKVFKRDGSLDSAHSFSQSYSVDSPKLILTSDTKKFTVVLEESLRKIQLRCLSRQSRDLIVLSIRCLAMRNYLISTKALQQVFHEVGQGAIQQSPGEQQTSLDVALELESSVREIQNLLVVNEAVTTEKNRLKRELIELEDSINETINAYQSLLACEEATNSPSAQEDEIMRLKHELDIAIVNKRKLRKRLAEANSEIEQIRHETERLQEEDKENSTSSHTYIKELEAELLRSKTELQRVGSKQGTWTQKIAQAKESNRELRGQLEKLKSSQVDVAADQSDSEELQRLRAENAALRDDNEALLGQRSFMSKKIEALNTQLAEAALDLDQTKALLEETKSQPAHDQEALSTHLHTPIEDDESRAALQAAEKEIARYREQCDSLTAQLSRAQAASRRGR